MNSLENFRARVAALKQPTGPLPHHPEGLARS